MTSQRQQTTFFSGYFILLITSLFCYIPCSAQLIAGAIPNGTFVQHPSVNLSLTTLGEDTASIDLNCDGKKDLKFNIISGNPGLDGGLWLAFSRIDTGLYICSDTSGSYIPPSFLKFGDTFSCNGNKTWVNSLSRQNNVHIAAQTPFLRFGALKLDSVFFEYRLGTFNGWIRVSYELTDFSTSPSFIKFKVDEVLSTCSDLSIQIPKKLDFTSLYPNPLKTGNLHLDSFDDVDRILIFSSSGQVVKTISQPSREIELQLDNGIYLFQINNKLGQVSTEKIMILN